MHRHLESLKYLYGGNISIQLPNDIFKIQSLNIKNKNGSSNAYQSSFSYCYVAVISFLYKYAFYVDIDNESYIQNADIKELLGYNRNTKSIDYIIKKEGLLDELGLTSTTKIYPTTFTINENEKINDIPLREYTMISDLDRDTDIYKNIKNVVRNRNYEVKEPLFFFEYKEDIGTLYNYANTHKITLDELIRFLDDDDLNNIDFLIYCYIKSKCKGLVRDTKAIGLNRITSELGMSADTFYTHLDILKKKSFIDVNHKGWSSGGSDSLEANEYTFKGV